MKRPLRTWEEQYNFLIDFLDFVAIQDDEELTDDDKKKEIKRYLISFNQNKNESNNQESDNINPGTTGGG